MNTKQPSFYIVSFGILMSIFVFGTVFADTVVDTKGDNIQYPIVELGNCSDKNSCKAYCDKPDNVSSCMAFAEKNNLMSKEQIDTANKFLNAATKGPGGCTTKESCESYCDDVSHINECVTFAEKSGILSPKDLAEAKLVQSAIARGIKPPPCGSKKACDAYCENPNNMKVCIAFGEEAGFIKGKDLEDAKKMMTAIDKGAIPLPCKGKEACDAYCSQPENVEACIKFAEAAGFMTEKDAEMMKKTGGKGPGGCKGKEECDAFCNKSENQEICFNFGKDNGLIPPEQLKQIEEGNKFRQNRGENNPGEQMRSEQAGPGGCKTQEECKVFCENNPEICKNFRSPQKNIMPQGIIQPMSPDGPTPPLSPNPIQTIQPGTAPQTIPGTFTPPPTPSPISRLTGYSNIANVFFSLSPWYNK